jgi:hypothetical protein
VAWPAYRHTYFTDTQRLNVVLTRIVKFMPNIEKVWVHITETLLQQPDNINNLNPLGCLVVLHGLRHVKELMVLRYSAHHIHYSLPPRFKKRPGGWVEVSFGDTTLASGLYGVTTYVNDDIHCVTTRAVRDMILTGDVGILVQRRQECLDAGR